jgi:cullin-associated NEDD8-dissociated protein 1
LIKKCPREIGPYVDRILELSQELISYDPNYTYEEEG